MKKKLFFAAVALVAFASCTSDDFIGDVTTPQDNSPSESDAIVFSSASQGTTRANIVGADAADLLGNKFIVMGVKGDGTPANMTDVFKNYLVEWAQNTAATTESNTSDWEYVGKGPETDITGVQAQSIKYWDFSTSSYDFAAYSVGKGNTIITTGTPTSNKILASAINYGSATTSAYTLQGSREDLTECYITDMKTVLKANYKQEVELQFRSLASKVRIALYETVPGYSVKDVRFYTDNTTAVSNNTTITNTAATLFGTNAFYTSGSYTVSFPTIGTANSSKSDYNKAHVAINGTTAASESTQGFGTLNYTEKERYEADGNYLQRSSQTPSFAGSSTYYQTVLPNENGVVLELRVNYTLVSTDGSGEEITIHGARAFVPQVYTKWLPNYAYTYIFKISDNTNGWTNPDDANDETLAGLFPITFDAVVLNSEETGQQTTITTVATPSITTYQKGHVYSATNEYNTGDIYVQVMREGVLVDELNDEGKSFFYKLSAGKTEAEVMDALNIRTSGTSTTIVGRNGLTLTPATINAAVTAIPGEDGNDITVNAGEAAKLSPSDAGTYAYVYDYTSGTPAGTDYITAVKGGTEAPADWGSATYYTDAACTNQAGTWSADATYYRKYTNLNHTYAVKVIKVQ